MTPIEIIKFITIVLIIFGLLTTSISIIVDLICMMTDYFHESFIIKPLGKWFSELPSHIKKVGNFILWLLKVILTIFLLLPISLILWVLGNITGILWNAFLNGFEKADNTVSKLTDTV